MIRQRFTSWSGRPIFLLVPDSAAGAVPEDLRATIEHAVKLTQKIERLKQAQREAMQAAAEAAKRWRPVDMKVAQRLCDDLRDAEIPHRGLVREALHVGNNKLRVDRCVVYALVSEGVIVYVGRSMNAVKERVRSHDSAGKIFDEVHLYQCRSESHMRDLEAVLIDQHRPLYNIRQERRVPGETS